MGVLLRSSIIVAGFLAGFVATTLAIAPLHLAQADDAKLPSIGPKPKTEGSRLDFKGAGGASGPAIERPRATSGASETVITHSLQFAITNVSCDSVLDPQQCFDVLFEVDEPHTPHFESVSDLSWQDAMIDIDAVMKDRVVIEKQPDRWKAIRLLAVQARQVVLKMNDPRMANVPERMMPDSLINLGATRGISRIEIVHRFLISGNRLLADHMIIDRSSANPVENRRLISSRASELKPEILSANFGDDIAKSVKAMAASLTAPVAKP